MRKMLVRAAVIVLICALAAAVGHMILCRDGDCELCPVIRGSLLLLPLFSAFSARRACAEAKSALSPTCAEPFSHAACHTVMRC